MIWPLFVLTAAAWQNPALHSGAEAAITGGNAYLAGEPSVLGKLSEERFTMAPNGSFVVWARSSSSSKGELQKKKPDLVVTDLEQELTYEIAKGLTESWRAAWGSGRKLWLVLEPTEDPAASRSLLTVQVGQPDSLRLVRVNPERVGEDLHLYPLPGQGGAILLGQKVTELSGGALKEEWILTRLDKDGRQVQSVSHGRQTSGPKGSFFSADGKSLVIEADRKGGAGPVQAQIGLDDLSLALTPDGSVAKPQGLPPLPFSLVHESGWLQMKGQSSSAKVTPAPGMSSLSTDGRRILYAAEGHLFVREVKVLTAAQLLNERYEKVRQAAERSARDVGRALRMAWVEGGMTYPKKSEALKVLGRLARWEESLKGLVIEFEGGPLPRGVDSSRTPYGRITTDYGQAVIFLDGTVTWSNGGSLTG